MEYAFTSSLVDHSQYAQAWKEYKALLTGLVADEDFWHVSYALKLLPYLLIARQEIDEMNLRQKRMRAALKGVQTRRRAAAIRDGFNEGKRA